MAETIDKLTQTTTTAEAISTEAETTQTAEVKAEVKEQKPTEAQKEQFKRCVKVLEKDRQSWLATAEAIETLRSLPPALWTGDKALAGVKRPKVGQYLQAKFSISTSRISQLAGALTARRELAEVKDADRLSCNALYEMSRFSTCKDNADGKSIAQIYEAIKAKGEVSERAVKAYAKQFKPQKPQATKSKVDILLDYYDDVVENNDLANATDEQQAALNEMCKQILNLIKMQTDEVA